MARAASPEAPAAAEAARREAARPGAAATLARRALPGLALLLVFGPLYARTLGVNGMFTWDEAEYATLGRSLARGDGYAINDAPHSQRPPVLPLAVAASLLVTGSERDGAARAPIVLFSLAALLVAWWGARSALGEREGLVAAALLGAVPLFWDYTAVLMTEVPFVCFFTAAVWHLHLGLAGRTRSFLWCWLFWGLALLTRYTALLFGPIAVVCTLVALALGGRALVERTVRTPAFWLGPLVGLAVVLPWLARQGMVFGTPLVGFKTAAGQLPAYTVATLPWHFYLTSMPGSLTWPVVLLALAGLAQAVRARDAAGLHCVAVFAVVAAWLSQYDFKEARQVSSVAPFVTALAAIGLVRVVLPLARRRLGDGLVVMTAALVVVAAPAVGRNLRDLPRSRTVGFSVFPEAMARLAAATPHEARVLGEPAPQIAWYADRVASRFPADPAALDEALAGKAWVVLVNFERGQPAYAGTVLRSLGPDDVASGAASVLEDGRYTVAFVAPALFRERVSGGEAPGP